VSSGVNTVERTVRNTFNSVDSITSNIWNGIENTIDNTIGGAEDAVDNAVSGMESAFNSAFNAIDNAVDNTINGLEDTITGTVNDAADAVSNTASDFYDAGADIVDSLVSSFTSLPGDVADALWDLPNEVADAFGDAADEAVETFNSYLPDSLHLPSIEVPNWDIDIPEYTFNAPQELGGGEIGSIGGQEFLGEGELLDIGGYGTGYDVPQLAEGGLVDSATMAMIGEGTQSEAVLPLDKLSTMLDSTFVAGMDAMSPTATANVSGGAQTVDVRLRVEGDDELTRLIRENAEVVVEENEEDKQDRLRRF